MIFDLVYEIITSILLNKWRVDRREQAGVLSKEGRNFMMPQAMKNVGPYADLWSQLKSMEHAVSRVENASDPADIAELDKERFEAMVSFVKQELEPLEGDVVFSKESFLAYEASELNYLFEDDIKSLLENQDSFKNWLQSKNLPFKEKTHMLLKSVESYLEAISESKIPGQAPKTELEIFRDLLSSLLSRIESTFTV
jgi:hypothetical protein